MNTTDEEKRQSRRKQKLEAHLTSGCGFGKSKRRLLDIFWSSVWPGLQKIGWKKVQGSGRQSGCLFFVPAGVNMSEARKGYDYFDRVRDVVDRICCSDAAQGEALVAEEFMKEMESLEEKELIECLANKSAQENSQPDEKAASLSSRVSLDLSWKDGGTSFPKRSSRVGKTYQATHIPRAGTFYPEDVKLDPDLRFDEIWHPNHGKDPKVLNFVQNQAHNKKGAALIALYDAKYNVEKAADILKDYKVTDGSDWTEQEQERFRAELFRCRKNIVAVSKSIGKSIQSVFAYYLAKYKKSNHYRVLKTVCEEERIEKLEASEQGLDACGICGEGGSLLICDGCEGEFHIHCLQPPLANIPEGYWECDDCVNRKFLEVRDGLIRKYYVRKGDSEKKKRKAAEAFDSEDESESGSKRRKSSSVGTSDVILTPAEPILTAMRDLAEQVYLALS